MNKILIVGAGSIGIYLGTLLFSKGNDVTLVGREKLKKLHKTVIIKDTPYELPKKVYDLPKNESFDYTFITSKLYDLENNLKLILKNKISSKYLIIIQNGIVEEKIYKPYLSGINFSSISVFEGFRLVENQLSVSSSGGGWETDSSLAGRKAAELLGSIGIKCLINRDLEIIKAEKTIMNCSVNLLSAIEKKTIFEICQYPETKEIVNALFEESYAVLNKSFKLKQKEELKKKFYATIAPLRHYSSTYQDAISGRKTEISFLNEYIILQGKKYGVKTPINEKIVKKFKAIYNIK